MDRQAVLSAFDEQVRRHPDAGAGGEAEHGPGTVRYLPAGAGWAGITWSDLDESSADAAIAAEIRRFSAWSQPWEWKHYSYDTPPDLPDRLLAAGFRAEPAEALLVAEIAELEIDVAPPPGVELRPVVDDAGIEMLVAVHDAVFGGDYSARGRTLLAELTRRPPAVAAVVALAGRTPIAAGRVGLPAGTDFASLWGGGTVPAWRSRGVFRAVVAYRATVARAHGYRYLQVDASDESRPILTRLGFVELATTTPFVYPASSRTHVRLG
jgi:hypothetical protein